MPYMVKDKESGCIIFKRTPEEKKLASLEVENQELRKQYDDLNSELNSLKEIVNKLISE